jgi:hypothetical protein
MNEQQLFIKSYKEGKDIYVFVYMEECHHCISVKPHWVKIERNIKKEFPTAHFIVTKVERKYISNLKKYLGEVVQFPTFLKINVKKPREKYEDKRDYWSLWSWITGKKKKGGKTRRNRIQKRRTKRKLKKT